KSTRELSLTATPRPPSKIRFAIATLCDAKISSKRLFALPGTTVAVGFPKIVSSVRPDISTFSWQVPTTEMELGPAAGKLARAAVIVVKAPGVAPLQSTAAPAANIRLEDNSSIPRHTMNLGREGRTFILSS